MSARILLAVGLMGVAAVAGAQQGWEQYVGQVHVKKALAEKMTPAQYQAHVEKMAKLLAAKANGTYVRAGAPTPNAPGDTCAAATPEIGALTYNTSGSTAGLTDDFDLPSDTTNPTCTASSACTGTGSAGSLPRGAIYTGTGTGPDQAFAIKTDAACTLTIAMTPTGGQDLALEVFQGQCSSSLADCNCVSDAGVANTTETVTLTAAAGQQYYVVVDGYSTGAAAPGPSGPFTLAVSGTGCQLTPVQLQSFGID